MSLPFRSSHVPFEEALAKQVSNAEVIASGSKTFFPGTLIQKSIRVL